MVRRRLVIERLHPLQVEAYRAMTPAQRIEAAFSTTDLLRSLITARVRGANPSWPEDRVRAEVASRFRGNTD